MSQGVSSSGPQKIPDTYTVAKDLGGDGITGTNIAKLNKLQAGLARLVGLTFTYEGKTIYLDKNARENAKAFLQQKGHPVGKGQLVSQALKEYVSSKVKETVSKDEIKMSKPLFEQALRKLGVKDSATVQILENQLNIGGDEVNISRDALLKVLKTNDIEFSTTDKRYIEFANQIKEAVDNFIDITRPEPQPLPPRPKTTEAAPVVVQQESDASPPNKPTWAQHIGGLEQARVEEKANLKAAREAFLKVTDEISGAKQTIEGIGKSREDITTRKQALDAIELIDKRLEKFTNAFQNYSNLAKTDEDKQQLKNDSKDYNKLLRTAKFHKESLESVFQQPVTLTEQTISSGETFEKVTPPKRERTITTVEGAQSQRATHRVEQRPKAPISDQRAVAKSLAEAAAQAVRARADRVAAQPARPAHAQIRIDNYNRLKGNLEAALKQAAGHEDLALMLMEVKQMLTRAEKDIMSGQLSYDELTDIIYERVGKFLNDTESGRLLENQLKLGSAATPKKLGDVAHFIRSIIYSDFKQTGGLSQERIDKLEAQLADYKPMPSAGMKAQRQDVLEKAEVAAKQRQNKAESGLKKARDAHLAAKNAMIKEYENVVAVLQNDPAFTTSLRSNWGRIGFADKYTDFKALARADLSKMTSIELVDHLKAFHNLIEQGKLPESVDEPDIKFNNAFGTYETARQGLVDAKRELRQAVKARKAALNAILGHSEAWEKAEIGPSERREKVGKLPTKPEGSEAISSVQRQKAIRDISAEEVAALGRKETREAIKQRLSALIKDVEAEPLFAARLAAGKGMIYNDTFVKAWNSIKREIGKMEQENYGPEYLSHLIVKQDPDFTGQGLVGGLIDLLVDEVYKKGEQEPKGLDARLQTLALLLDHYKKIGKG